MTPQELQVWLEWAGGKLLSTPISRPGPADARAIWPMVASEFPDDAMPIPARHRPPPPSPDEVGVMDEILSWILLCPHPTYRRILQARSLVAPHSGRHLITWGRLAGFVRADPRTVRRWHSDGLAQVARRLDPAKISQLRRSPTLAPIFLDSLAPPRPY